MDPGELFGDSPEAARQIGVLRGGGASDEHRRAAHVREMAGSGEAVAGDVADSGVQDRQRAAVGVLRQPPDRECVHEIGRAATSVVVDVRCDETGMRRGRQHPDPAAPSRRCSSAVNSRFASFDCA